MSGPAANAAGSSANRVGGVSAALSTPPEGTCVSAVSTASGQSRQYWRCPSRTWSSARATCLAVGLDLAKVSNQAENAFLRDFVTGDSWLGGSDQVTEGTWRWGDPVAGQHFWQGNFIGSAVGGAYVNWDLLEPDGLLGDCLELNKGSGKWRERGCGSSRSYVCGGPEDQCPSDPNKDAPGQCGCGTPDLDSDSDGTLDCQDSCPSDAKHTVPGQCGCLGEPNLAPPGTPCSDGLCSANDECDGQGQCGFAAECAPASNCSVYGYQGHAYAFCPTDKSWGNARASCQSVAGMDLVHIGDAAEDVFIHDHLPAPAWIGATDSASEGAWKWSDDGSSFWSGLWNGAPVTGAYANWHALQPDDFLWNEDCAIHKKFSNSWLDQKCSSPYDYVCEVSDQCPADPQKHWLGICGCGVADSDGDDDGLLDCQESCPADPNKQDPGACGCGNPDVDSDGDGPLDCQESCPADPHKQVAGTCGCGRAETDSDLDGNPDCLPCAGTLLGAAWPMSGGCRGGAQRSPFVGPAEAEDAWSFTLAVSSTDAPAIGVGDVVYVGASDGLYALAADGSSVLWHFATAQPVRTSPALDAAGRLFFGSDDGTVYALQSATGGSIWSVMTGAAVRASPTLGSSGAVLVGNDGGSVRALDPASGALLWSYQVGGAISSAVTVLADGRTLAASTNHTVVALRPQPGLSEAQRLAWQTNLGAAARTSVTVAQVQAAAYVGTDAGKLIKLRTVDGSVAWEFSAGGPVIASAALGALGLVHFVANDGYVYTIEDQASSAVERWRHLLATPSTVHPTVGADGTLYVGSGDRITALRPFGDAAGRLVWESLVPGGVRSASAIGSGGTLVFAAGGLVRAIGSLASFCPTGTTCASYLGVNYCGHQMPGTPFTVPAACPESGVCAFGQPCTVLAGFRFCFFPCNLGD